MIAFLLAIIIALNGAAIRVVDERGAPVARASVVFRAANGATVSVVTGADGRAAAPTAFDAVSATVTATGFEPATETLTAGDVPLVLRSATSVIGSVTVATGSAQNLHQLAVPAATLDAAAIAQTPETTTDALLRELPGFDFVRDNSAFTNYGDLRVSFSGAGEDRGLVLADDVPAQDGFGGQVNWLAYPPQTLVAAELLRGPGAALYGANAIGGVLELRQFAPNANWEAPPDGLFTLDGGTPQLAGGSFAYRFAIAPKLTASVASSTQREAYDDLAPGYQTPIDQLATSTSIATRSELRYALSPATSLAVGGLFTNDQQYEGRPHYTFARDMDQEDLHFATDDGPSTISLVAYDRDTDILNTSDSAPASPGVLRYTQFIPTRESGVALNYFLTGTYDQFAIRTDEKYVYGDASQDGPTGAFQSAGTGRQQYAGLAFENTYDRGPFQLIAGLRGDQVGFFDGQTISSKTGIATLPAREDRVLSPRLAGRLDITKGISLRASLGGGFREPFLNELLRGYQIGSVVYAANPNLVPERSANNGFGIDALVGRGRLSLDFTNTTVNNAIEFVTLSPTLQERENVAQTKTNGETLTYTTPLARCVRLRAYGTSQYARVTNGPADIIAKRLQYVPAQSADVSLDAGSAQLRYGADVGYDGVTFADDLNTEVLPAAVLVGAHVTAPFADGTSLSLDGTNLTAAHYLSSIDRYGPPTSVSLRLRVPLGPKPATPPPAACP